MHYTCEISINRPVAEVVAAFENPDNLKLWMDGLQHFEHISGEMGKEGAKTLLEFKMGKREMKMTETILKNNLPQEYRAIYETKGVYNTIRNSFIPESETSTRYISENTFKFEGFMKFIGFTMPGAFKKQSMKYLTSFKNFVEKQNS